MRAYPRLGIFLMNSALLKPFLVFGDVLSHNYRNNKKNETIPLSLTMPVPENEENGECNGLLWQDLSVVTSHSGEYLLHSSSGFVANGDVCGVLGPSGSGKQFSIKQKTKSSPWQLTAINTLFLLTTVQVKQPFFRPLQDAQRALYMFLEKYYTTPQRMKGGLGVRRKQGLNVLLLGQAVSLG